MNKIIAAHPLEAEDDCVHVRGKRVAFYGVPSSFFSPTRISDQAGPIEVEVLAPGALPNSTVPILFSQSSIPGYVQTKYRWKGYMMQLKVENYRVSQRVPKIGHVYSHFPFKWTHLSDVQSSDADEYYLHKRLDGWELSYDRGKSQLQVRLTSQGIGTVVALGKSLHQKMKVRAAFHRDWIRGIDVEEPAAGYYLSKYHLVKELKMYAMQMNGLLYSKVLKCLPPEVIFLIDNFIF